MSRVRIARGVVGWVKPVTVQGPPIGLGTRRVRKRFTYQTLATSPVFTQQRKHRGVMPPSADPVAQLLGEKPND